MDLINSNANNITYFYPYTDVCKALHTQYFPECCKQKNIGIRMGFKPTTTTFANLEQISYQLDQQDCLVARGNFICQSRADVSPTRPSNSLVASCIF